MNTFMEECVNAFSRFNTSWQEAMIMYEDRQERGLQPPLPGADLQTMVWGNVMYLTVCGVLYLTMLNRKEGLNLKPVIVCYNIICVVLAGYVVVGIILFKLDTPGTFACNPLLTNAKGQDMAFIFWVFYAQKYWEFCDTWFYILRKSFRQVTFLHLFHHSSITLVVGSIISFDFNGDMYLPILLNAIVHVLMYSHYLLTACGIKSWWRPYLTSLQITQFIAISSQSYLAYAKGGPGCGAPDFAKLILICYMGSMIILFLNFFVRRYVLHKSTASMSGVIKSVEESQDKVFRGNVELDVGGNAVVVLPHRPATSSSKGKHLRHYQYQLTPVGASMPDLYVRLEIDTKQYATGAFVIAGGHAHGRVSWAVHVHLDEDEHHPVRHGSHPIGMKKVN